MSMKLSMPHLKFRRPEGSTSEALATGGLGSQAIKHGTLFSFNIYFVFDQMFPQVRRIALASFAFHITNIAASVVCVNF